MKEENRVITMTPERFFTKYSDLKFKFSRYYPSGLFLFEATAIGGAEEGGVRLDVFAEHSKYFSVSVDEEYSIESLNPARGYSYINMEELENFERVPHQFLNTKQHNLYNK